MEFLNFKLNLCRDDENFVYTSSDWNNHPKNSSLNLGGLIISSFVVLSTINLIHTIRKMFHDYFFFSNLTMNHDEKFEMITCDDFVIKDV